jgi:signal transduction histidine kinase
MIFQRYRGGLQLKLRASIVLAVIIGLLIPLFVAGLFTFRERHHALDQRLAADHRRITEIISLGMQEPLWNLSQDAAYPLFESVLSDERITALTVRDMQFGVFLRAERPERRHGRQTSIDRNVIYNDRVIGFVTVEMDSGQLDTEIAHTRTAFVVTALGQLLLSLILIVALLQQRLLAPLHRLMDESQRLARRQLAEPFHWRGDDELSMLGNSLESTRQALQSLFSEIEAKNLALERDIERRMQVERELQQHRLHLEEIVRERTAQLSVAKERAEVANQAKTAFLASMSHELRTPLNAVIGYAQVLRRDSNLTARQQKNLETIQQSGEHLLALITDLLDLTKIEAGKLELYSGEFAFQPFLQTIIDIIRVRAEQKGIRFGYDIKGLPRLVIADEQRLRQVLLNLLGNAVKFTDNGTITLNVVQVSRNDTQAQLRFEVRDTGIGMEPGQLDRIFQPFEQVGDPRRRFGGTGLGLSISRQLVHMMGSEIFVDSDPGTGSVFGFVLDVGIGMDHAADTDSAARDVDAEPGTRNMAASPDFNSAGMAEPFIASPPSEEMKELHQLAMAGNMRAIREYAAHIASLDPHYKPFADRLHELAGAYQSKAIVNLVEQHMQPRTPS